MNPLKTLSFLRHKIMQVHSTNVYDNLPDEEVVRRDGKLYFVQVRAYLPMADVVRLSNDSRFHPTNSLHGRRACFRAGRNFWAIRRAAWRSGWRSGTRSVWKNGWCWWRICRISRFRRAWTRQKVEDILKDAPTDFRFHSELRRALESFLNTLPLLHPRGYLQVQDIFVTDLDQYRLGFYGPGKLDGSLLNWVNGALLKEVAERAGYDVHFAPFHYRKGSRTSVLYTTRRE